MPNEPPTKAIRKLKGNILISAVKRTLHYPRRFIARIRERVQNHREIMQLVREHDELLREIDLLQKELRIKEEWLRRAESDSQELEQ